MIQSKFLMTEEQHRAIRYALAINRVMAADENGDYTIEATPKIITRALKIMDELEVQKEQEQ